jgi:hypothetical protein
LGAITRVRGISASRGLSTPESYLGAARADRFATGPLTPGVHDFGAPPVALAPDHLAYSGHWQITQDSATALGAGGLDLVFNARRVYLVLGSSGRARAVRVLLDGRPIPAHVAGGDVHHASVRVSGQRLYRLVNLPALGRHRLRLEPQAGITGYAFTFG